MFVAVDDTAPHTASQVSVERGLAVFRLGEDQHPGGDGGDHWWRH